MGINLQLPGLTELRPRITVIGVGGAGGNAVNNMVEAGLEGVEFIAANTDAQALASSGAYTTIQMGIGITEGLGAGSRPEIGAAAAEEAIEEIRSHLDGVHLLFITAGMGGGTGTGAAPIIARTAKELGVLTVAVVTKPFEFEGQRRMRTADAGIAALAQHVDTLIVIPNQNLFLVASERTTFADAFSRADDVLRSGVSCITDLMVKEGLINLDFADVRTVMQNMGTALMGTGEAEGEKRALQAAEAAISNPLLGEVSMRGAKGLLVSITGSFDMTLYEVEEAASRIRREVDPEENPDVNIIVGATFDQSLQNRLRVSVVATGIHSGVASQHVAPPPPVEKDAGLAERMQSVQQEPPQRRAPFGGLREQPARQPQDRRVVLEPKGRRGGDDVAPPVPADNGQRFEPVPPAKTARAPRRPLTFSDFPELGQSDGGGNNGASNRSSGKPRGFFDWMAGRDRGTTKSNASPQTKSVALQPRTNHEKTAAEQGRRNGASHDDTGDDMDGDPAATRQNGDEAIDIPKFFRKPAS
ncbi:cell division protein FtsZ [Rhodomicrobium lacus]|uniref:cell division protein FtsZ n=1 Tax=Rhodomicrobium lacus TaxID=2498452 RepID=UPI0026E3100D|nr:cell division protein FtsZ [Rhodomicrobium lacus]WKW49597.1 cell division protein FtsZ [Rhodomicrobium lacus]